MKYLTLLAIIVCAAGLSAQGGDFLARARTLHRDVPLIDDKIGRASCRERV